MVIPACVSLSASFEGDMQNPHSAVNKTEDKYLYPRF